MPSRTKSRARYRSSITALIDSTLQHIIQYTERNELYIRQPNSINLNFSAAGKRWHGWATPGSAESQPGIPTFFTIVTLHAYYCTVSYDNDGWVREPQDKCLQAVVDNIGEVLTARYE